ncbi:MAG: hypothetical protein JRG95_25100 [Deltaproteobacteria bacterium]|nr:hypothetical protein [Deltaproteobacteria bacterium]
MAVSLRIEDAGPDEIAEGALREALVPILGAGAPGMLLASLFWSQVDRPGAPAAAAALLAIGCVLCGMGLPRHTFRDLRPKTLPPRSAGQCHRVGAGGE